MEELIIFSIDLLISMCSSKLYENFSGTNETSHIFLEYIHLQAESQLRQALSSPNGSLNETNAAKLVKGLLISGITKEHLNLQNDSNYRQDSLLLNLTEHCKNKNSPVSFNHNAVEKIFIGLLFISFDKT
jgi:hypothetical protein